MTWFPVVLITLLVIEALAAIACIGESRPVITRTTAIITVIANALLVWGVVEHIR